MNLEENDLNDTQFRSLFRDWFDTIITERPEIIIYNQLRLKEKGRLEILNEILLYYKKQTKPKNT